MNKGDEKECIKVFQTYRRDHAILPKFNVNPTEDYEKVVKCLLGQQLIPFQYLLDAMLVNYAKTGDRSAYIKNIASPTLAKNIAQMHVVADEETSDSSLYTLGRKLRKSLSAINEDNFLATMFIYQFIRIVAIVCKKHPSIKINPYIIRPMSILEGIASELNEEKNKYYDEKTNSFNSIEIMKLFERLGASKELAEYHGAQLVKKYVDMTRPPFPIGMDTWIGYTTLINLHLAMLAKSGKGKGLLDWGDESVPLKGSQSMHKTPFRQHERAALFDLPAEGEILFTSNLLSKVDPDERYEPISNLIDLPTLQTHLGDDRFIASLVKSELKIMYMKLETYNTMYNKLNANLANRDNMDAKVATEQEKLLKKVKLVQEGVETRIRSLEKKTDAERLTYKRAQVKLILEDPKNGILSIKGEARENIRRYLYSQIYIFAKSPELFAKNFNNYILMGPAGSGKTKLAGVMAFTYNNLGVLGSNDPTGKYQMVTRADLVGQFIGHTAKKTRDALESILEGVLLIDEAYQLSGCPDSNGEFASRDFASESITEIVNFIDKYIGLGIIIAAGYEKQMSECFLSINEGMRRRFPHNLRLLPYSGLDLYEILIHFISQADSGVVLDEGQREYLLAVMNTLAEVNYNDKPLFDNQAGDMLNLSGMISKDVIALQLKSLPYNIKRIQKTFTKFFKTKGIKLQLDNDVIAERRQPTQKTEKQSKHFVKIRELRKLNEKVYQKHLRYESRLLKLIKASDRKGVVELYSHPMVSYNPTITLPPDYVKYLGDDCLKEVKSSDPYIVETLIKHGFRMDQSNVIQYVMQNNNIPFTRHVIGGSPHLIDVFTRSAVQRGVSGTPDLVTSVMGIISASYHMNPRLQKRILVLGDHHTEKADCKVPGMKNVSQFLKHIVEQDKSQKYDIFFEFGYYTHGMEQPTSNPAYNQGYLFGLVKDEWKNCIKLDKTMCEYQNVRVHYTDMRQFVKPVWDIAQIMVHQFGKLTEGSTTWVDFLTNLSTMKFALMDLKKLTGNKLTRGWIMNTYKIGKQMTKCPYSGVVQLLNAFIEREIVSNLVDIDELINFIDRFEETDQMKHRLRRYSDTIFDLTTAIMDAYTLSRLFSQFQNDDQEPHNIIIYAGDSHSENYRKFFDKAEFTRIGLSKSVSDSDVKCVNMSSYQQPFF